jgi:hypothetical protein
VFCTSGNVKGITVKWQENLQAKLNLGRTKSSQSKAHVLHKWVKHDRSGEEKSKKTVDLSNVQLMANGGLNRQWKSNRITLDRIQKQLNISARLLPPTGSEAGGTPKT